MQDESDASVATQLAQERTSMACDRTSMAHDRTLMAWIRTATSLISFGFTLYKFFHIEFRGRSVPGQVVGPREFAVLMIAIGLFALAMATVQYRMDRKRLKAQCPDIPGSMTGAIAALIAVLGIVAFIAVILGK